eukprot:CAMPEP_0167740550 /NCGR_PEP_ID=MMETSP0110_2-20121227/343_1 /TAXON_ID=629695 /ORGANISM="Gymnochlora sp., Strain CCMP2014" /LENGTH=327 /DNA_ID=CAMNT_0007624463 /DNA_START=349 /DNA_END=1335 /DNA_ORIENTATION=+
MTRMGTEISFLISMLRCKQAYEKVAADLSSAEGFNRLDWDVLAQLESLETSVQTVIKKVQSQSKSDVGLGPAFIYELRRKLLSPQFDGISTKLEDLQNPENNKSPEKVLRKPMKTDEMKPIIKTCLQCMREELQKRFSAKDFPSRSLVAYALDPRARKHLKNVRVSIEKDVPQCTEKKKLLDDLNLFKKLAISKLRAAFAKYLNRQKKIGRPEPQSYIFNNEDEEKYSSDETEEADIYGPESEEIKSAIFNFRKQKLDYGKFGIENNNITSGCMLKFLNECKTELNQPGIKRSQIEELINALLDMSYIYVATHNSEAYAERCGSAKC